MAAWPRKTAPKAIRAIDPAAGAGVFLELASQQNLAVEAHGIEIDPTLVAVWGGREGVAFWSGDGLNGIFPGVENNSFDLVIGNPPFGRLDAVLAPKQVRPGDQSRFVSWWAGDERPSAGLWKKTPIEVLFVERALQLVRPGGVVAFVMPEGYVANTRLQAQRDWLLRRAEVLAVIGLPPAVFRHRGLNAQTAVLVWRKRESEGGEPTALLVDGRQEQRPLDRFFGEVLSQRARPRGWGALEGARIGQKQLAGCRWDARFWRGRRQIQGVARRFKLGALGDFIEHLTYGPIITGRRASHTDGGTPVIRQGDFELAGLRLEGALRVAPGSEHDPPRSRVQQGDLLLPRSGAGALGRNRMAVYIDSGPANVGCFVDLIRLGGINPFYVWFFFKTVLGWQQIRALINGVGTPNINFAEIRSLRLALLPPSEQRVFEKRYMDEILPLHNQSEGKGRLAAEFRFKELIALLEQRLEGGVVVGG